MTLKVYADLEQGSQEWLDARCGLLTASVIGQLLTPTGKVAKNDKSRRLVYDLLAQRMTKIVEPVYQSYDMIRGHEDEIEARVKYSQEIALIEDVGFITEDRWGFTIGYSPDGLVAGDGLIECKSRRHALQIETIISQAVPSDYIAQIQTGIMVSGRKWCDFISYPAMGGGDMMVLRVHSDNIMQDALLDAASGFEDEIKQRRSEYIDALNNKAIRFFETERRQELEIHI